MPNRPAAGPRTPLVVRFARDYPGRTAATVALLILAGLAEGVGIATLLPVLELTAGNAGPGGAPAGRIAVAALTRLGLPLSLGPMLLLVVLAVALKGILRFLALRAVGSTVARVAGDLRLRLLRAIMAARWGHFIATPTGHVANALSVEAMRAAGAYRNACIALAALIQITVYAAVAFVVAWRLALVAGACGIALALLLRGPARVSRRTGQEYAGLLRGLAGRVTELVHAIQAVKSMGRDASFLRWLEGQSDEIERVEAGLLLRHESYVALQEPLLAGALALGVYAGATWGDQPLPVLLLTAFLLHRVMGRFQVIQTEVHAVAVAEGLFWSLDAQTRSAEGAREPAGGTLEPPALASAITLERVRFERDGRAVLDDLTLEIPRGAFVALTGPSGSGKTTLVELLIGLQDATAGRILIDGVALSDLDRRAWRRRVGHVPQDTVLLHDTVARNVTLGLEGVTESDVREALEAAGAWEFVARLPEGVDAVVGERGLKLSGGERQRLAIARALIARPTLLILDEATAGLDRRTEAGIWETVRALRGRVTVIAVSHNAGASAQADLVHHLEPATHGQATVGPPRPTPSG